MSFVSYVLLSHSRKSTSASKSDGLVQCSCVSTPYQRSDIILVHLNVILNVVS